MLVIAGLGVGFLVMIIPPYQAELCHPDIRGRVTGLQQFMLGIGSLVAAWVSYACYTYIPDNDSGQWRISLGIQVVPAVVLAALIMLFPESPRYVYTRYSKNMVCDSDILQLAHRQRTGGRGSSNLGEAALQGRRERPLGSCRVRSDSRRYHHGARARGQVLCGALH